MDKATLILDILEDLREMDIEENILIRGVAMGLKLKPKEKRSDAEKEIKEVS